MLGFMRKDAVVAEVGVAFGEFSREILNRCTPNQLQLIDAWSTERYQKGLEQVRSDLHDEIEAGQVTIHQGLSTEVLPEFDDGTFDWVYIDTNHTYATTLLELEIADKKVKSGGRIAGHDFCSGNVIKPVPYGVVEAVTKFCGDRDWQFEFLTLESHGHFSFSLMKLN
jgi:hypothetical protein